MKFNAPMLLVRRLVLSVEQNGLRGAVARSSQRLFRSLSNHGLSGTFNRAFRKPPEALAVAAAVQQPDPFDIAHGTDTGGCISGEDLSSASLSALYVTVYLGIASSAFTQALADIPFKPDGFTFVDLGCGKGRALMLAADLPFSRLVGVELAPELCAVARANLATNPEWASRISVFNGDATTFAYPGGPLLIFLYHPFLAPVLRRALANLERQLRRNPRETWVLYADNPRFTEVLDGFPFLREVSHTSYPYSDEDLAAGQFPRTHEQFTLYSTDLSR
jgi:SAM-dependent methyltransferase